MTNVQINLCWTGALVTASLFLPLVGRLIDRFGAFRCLLTAAVPFGVAVGFLGAVQTVRSFYKYEYCATLYEMPFLLFEFLMADYFLVSLSLTGTALDNQTL